MGRKMSRGKQQVLFNYLPGKTFDFERVATIAQVTAIRGSLRNDLNRIILLRKVKENASAWDENLRPALSDETLDDPERFVLLDPKGVQAEMFPKVFWCQNRQCGRIFDYSERDGLPEKKCPQCRSGQLIQLRFVKIHRCGALRPLLPQRCQRCNNTSHMALDARGSERFANFLWRCRRCGSQMSYYASVGNCPACQWPEAENRKRQMEIEVHRAGRTFYAHTAVMLNIPHSDLDAFLTLLPEEWAAIAAAKYFALPEVVNRDLSELVPSSADRQSTQDVGLSGADLDILFKKYGNDPVQFYSATQALRQQRQQEKQASSPGALVRIIEQRTGVERTVWKNAGQEMLEAAMSRENKLGKQLFRESRRKEQQVARSMGINDLMLVPDYPIITATYGYSRADYRPRECRLNPFPPDQDYNGKIPIFVDEVQADAILFALEPERVCRWLERNGYPLALPPGSDPNLSLRASFVQLFDNLQLNQTLLADRAPARLVFGLLHSLSHLCVRQAALLCGLDSTSLSEYVLPRTLTFAIYCNHRFGATIGALTALYEQSLIEWLNAINNARRCVYDPVCYDREGSCHACTHLAETSCRFFNLNLNRAFLFGGPDIKLGEVTNGYFDPTL